MFTVAILVTQVKECVMDPVGFLNAELDALLHRLIETDVTKWQALRTLGLGAVPAAGKGGETV